MAGLPSSFQYFVNKLAGVQRNSVRIIPTNQSTVNSNGVLIFDLPSNSIVDLTSMNLRGDFIFRNAVGGTNGVRMVPQPHTLFRNVSYLLNGQTVSGIGSQNHNHLMELLRRCTVGEDYELSRCDEYSAVPICKQLTEADAAPSGSQVATNSQSQHFHFNTWYGLARAPNAPNFDTAIFGDLRIQIQLEGTAPILSSADSGTNDVDWQLQNCDLVVDVIQFSDPTYDNLISAMMAEGRTLAIPFPEYFSQISSTNSAMKFNVASQSLDLIGYAPLASTYSSFTQLTSTTGVVADASVSYGPNFTRFRIRNSSNSSPAVNSTSETYYWMINNQVYPKNGQTAVIDGITYTKEVFMGGPSANNYSLLFKGIQVGASGTALGVAGFQREQYQLENCIVAHKLCLEGPAHQSASHTLSGLDTRGTSSTITLNTNGWSTSDYTLLFAQGSAVLEAGAGQVISVVY